MKTTLLAILSAAAAVHATGDGEHGLYKGPIGFPPGIEAPPTPHLPHKPPPFDKPLPIWHPPHGDVFIDDCDEDDEDWHWAWKKHGDKPHHGPPHKWITTTVTVTKTEGPEPTEEVTESVCPVPVTDEPAPPAEPTGGAEEPAPEPTAEAPEPEPTEPPAEEESPAEEPPAEEPPVEDDSPVEPPADAPDADASSVPQPPAEAGAGAKAAGVLAVAAGLVAALF